MRCLLVLLLLLPIAAGDQDLVFNNEAEPKTLDPHLMTGVVEARLALALSEGLTSLDPATLEPRPGLAESWDRSPDGLTYTFHLRDGLCWSDGTPLTADDVRASWLRALDPATAAPYAELLDAIVGAEPRRNGKGPESAVGLEAVDTRTLTVRLERPCGYFLQLTAFHISYPVPLAAIRERAGGWTQPGMAPGCGPFLLRSWIPRERIVLEPNPRWHGRAGVRLTSITALPIGDLDAAYRLFLQGAIHWMPSIPQAKWEELRWRPEYYATPYFASYFYRFNCSKPPFNDKRVRRALSLAVDRAQITGQILRAGQEPATWLTPRLRGYEPPAGLKPDRDQARRLLAEAGYPEGRGLPPIELLFNTSDAHRQVAEALQQQLQDALGVRVILANREWKTYIADTERLDYQMARASWVGDFLDPETFIGMWVTGGGNNRTGWSHAGFDRLLDEARRATDPIQRAALYRDAERIVVEDELPILPLYIYVCQGLISDRVRGWSENVRDEHPWQHLWLAP